MPEEITQSVTSSRHVIGKQAEIPSCPGFHLRLKRLKPNAGKMSEKYSIKKLNFSYKDLKTQKLWPRFVPLSLG